jgi:protocatechuate 3,4-dioxygenase beta subunit
MDYQSYFNVVLPKTSTPPGASMPLTEPDILGPFYVAGAPFLNNIVPQGYTGGRALVLTGNVYTVATNGVTQPGAGLTLDFWQADADGVYDDETWPDPQSPPPATIFRFRGKQQVVDGTYSLTTVKPGHYSIGTVGGVEQFRTSHIHCRVWDNENLLLTTQLYFPGDVWNAQDHWYSPDRQMTDEVSATGVLEGHYDFVVKS